MAARILLQGVRRELVTASFRQFFGIGEQRARLLVALYCAQGDPVKPGELQRGVDSHRRPTAGAIWESIRLLRTCMEVEAIDKTDDGYALTEIGMAECRQAIADTVMSLTGVAGPALAAEPVRGPRTMEPS